MIEIFKGQLMPVVELARKVSEPLGLGIVKIIHFNWLLYELEPAGVAKAL